VLKEKEKEVCIGSLMLVSLCPKPVYYASAASCQQTLQRIWSRQQANPTASDRGAKERGRGFYGEKAGEKRLGQTQKDMQIKLQPKITFNSAEKCKTLDY